LDLRRCSQIESGDPSIVNRLLPALEGLSCQSLLVGPLGTWTTCCPSIIFPGKLPCDRARVIFLNLLHQHAAMHRDVPTFELRCPFRGTMNRSAILYRHQSLFQVQPRLSTGLVKELEPKVSEYMNILRNRPLKCFQTDPHSRSN
jgi:hypothetical protein